MPGSVLGAGVTTLNKARSCPREFTGRPATNQRTASGSGESSGEEWQPKDRS